MDSEIVLSPDYRPSKDEEYMCEMHLESDRIEWQL